MPQLDTALSDKIVARTPLAAHGASGNVLEQVTLADGRALVHKRVSPEWDWLSRATGDDGRAVAMWSEGLFLRIPSVIDHATVSVEADGAAWSVFMRDVSAAMLPDERRLDRHDVRRVLAALAEMHLAFWGERFPQLCSLEQRYELLSPRTAQREQHINGQVADLIERCWELFGEMVPSDVSARIMAIVERPALLAEQLARCEQTLIHGDVRIANLGLTPDSVVLVDWGERTGTAPPAVELASFLAFDARRFDVSRDDVIADFATLYGERFDEHAMQLALIGGLVQLGCNFLLPVVLGGGDDARAVAREELAWWTVAVSRAFEIWSPI